MNYLKGYRIIQQIPSLFLIFSVLLLFTISLLSTSKFHQLVSIKMNPPLKLLLFTAATMALLTFTDRASSAIRCPNCGSTPIPYPLSTSPTCGDQSYKIRCDSTNGTLQFDTLNNSYPITSINPSIQQLVIKPSPLLPNTCVSSDLVHGGVQLDSTLPFNIPSGNTIMFMNCTSFMLSTPINCSSSSLCHVYINSSTRGFAPCGGASSSICCTFRSGGTVTAYVIRPRVGGCSAYTSFVNLDSDLAVDRWPDPGLQIKWTLPREPQCVSQADCDGNSTCGSDPIVGGLARRCFCMSGFDWHPILGVCTESATCHNPSGCGGSTDRTALIAEKTQISSSTIIAIVAPITAVAVLFVAVYCILTRRARKKNITTEDEIDGKDILTAETLQFDLRTIQAATNRFSTDNKLGAGGFGVVYKGVLPNGKEIAVKRLSKRSRQGAEEFKNEVVVVAKLQHRNLVRLHGFCLGEEEKILVYEFVPNKSLDYFLYDPEKQGKLDWSRRYKIIGGIARGILYLHEDSRLRIIHRDLKASNVLLDEEMNPKIADFGMARIVGVDQTQGNTSKIAGTYGYMAPEYAMQGQFSVKSDVYSFGVLILEIITGKKNSSFYQTNSVGNLLSYAWELCRDETPMQLLDSNLTDSYSTDEVLRCIHIGLLCVQEDPATRPTMTTVVHMLNSYSVSPPLPQQPAFFIGSKTELSMHISDKSTKSKTLSIDAASITELCPR